MDTSPIIAWNRLVISLIQDIRQPNDVDLLRRSTSEAARIYALLNVAMHDAMGGLAGNPQLAPGWVRHPAPALSATLMPFAAIGAGCQVLDGLFSQPQREQQIKALMRELRDQHAGGGGVTAEVTQALEYGKDVATALLSDSRYAIPADDLTGDLHLPTNPLPEGIGRLGFALTAARYRRLAPFVMDRGDWFHAPPPQVLESFEYAREWHEVYALGSRAVRAAADDSFESQMAKFWRGGVGTSQETGFWLEIARVIAADPARALSLHDQARVMTAVAVANCDAMITSWSSKWTYTFWRPQDAIRRGDQDGNPATFADPAWAPYNGSQGASPEHTSGTATFAGACSTVLARLFGDAVDFEVDFQSATGLTGPQKFHHLTLTAEIAVRTRIWNGIHFASAGTSGLLVGRSVGRRVIDAMGLEPL